LLKKIDTLKKTRENLLNVIKDLSNEQLNEIPIGFNNNIIWNLGHLLATQQVICYFRAGLKMTIDEQNFANYKPDTKPNTIIENAEIIKMKELFLSVVGGFEHDFKSNVFQNYNSWTNRYGIEITTIEDAMTFVLFHEGLHLGYIMALKRVIKG
jgi:hypothetical protein